MTAIIIEKLVVFGAFYDIVKIYWIKSWGPDGGLRALFTRIFSKMLCKNMHEVKSKVSKTPVMETFRLSRNVRKLQHFSSWNPEFQSFFLSFKEFCKFPFALWMLICSLARGGLTVSSPQISLYEGSTIRGCIEGG